MSDLYESLARWLRDPIVRASFFAFVFWIVGLVVARLVVGGLARAAAQHVDAQRVTMARRFAFYALAILVTLAALDRGGIDMGVFFGAAGILTVAFGFAAQTSMSNLISGIFLIGERSFGVGDWITVGNTTGEVLSIDLLSAKLRTPENLFVRVPNETLIKADIINLSRFPIRRVEIDFRVEYETDLAALAKLLDGIVQELPECLLEPKTHFFVQDFTDAAVWVKFRFWTRREVFLEARASVQALAQERLSQAGIRQPTQRMRMEAPVAPAPAMEPPPDVS